MIGADDVTLDLNGHRIDGDGKPSSDCAPREEFCDIGVLNDGHDGVTVRDGSVREFGVGAFVGKAAKPRARDLLVKEHFFGFVVRPSARSLVRDSSGNGSTAREGATGWACSARTASGSSTTHSAITPTTASSGRFDHNLIKGNRVSGNDGEGLLMEGGERNQINHNRVVETARGSLSAPAAKT